MTHLHIVSKEAPAKATVGIANKGVATLVPNWPGTLVDFANLAWYICVTAPASKVFGFTPPAL